MAQSTTLLATGEFALPEILPGKSALLPLHEWHRKGESDGEVWMTVAFCLRTANAWAEAGHEIAWFQHRLNPSRTGFSLTQAPSSRCRDPHVDFNLTTISVSANSHSFCFDRAQGHLKSWIVNGTPILEADPITRAALIPGIWRPPTDNDRPSALPYWQRFGVQAMTSRFISFSQDEKYDPASPETGTVQLRVKTFLSPQVLDWGITADITYIISPSGSLHVHAALRPSGFIPKHIPRLGLDLRLNSALQQTTWFGLGPGESYPDKQAAQRVGIWSVPSVADLQTRYDVPQEGGNRMGTRWVSFASPSPPSSATKEKKPTLRATAPTPFSFQASRYRASVIENAKHPCDLAGKEEGATLLRLDHAVAGVGTAACGPGPREDMLVKLEEGKTWEFEFLLEVV